MKIIINLCTRILDKKRPKINLESFCQKKCSIFFKHKKIVSMAKLRNIYRSVWQKWEKYTIFCPIQNFSIMYIMFFFQQKTIKIVLMAKKQRHSQRRLGKNNKNMPFWLKWPNSGQKIANKMYLDNFHPVKKLNIYRQSPLVNYHF